MEEASGAGDEDNIDDADGIIIHEDEIDGPDGIRIEQYKQVYRWCCVVRLTNVNFRWKMQFVRYF